MTDQRLDKGRMLVSITRDHHCSRKIKIEIGDRRFMVNMDEDLAPVDMAWVDRFLGLEKKFSAPVLNSLLVLFKIQTRKAMAIGRMKVWLSKVPILSLGRLKVDDCLEGKECGSKVDGPSSEIPTQSNKMKAQSGGMADLGPASSKYIYEVGEVERSFDEIEGDFDEASVDEDRKNEKSLGKESGYDNETFEGYGYDINRGFRKENIVLEVMKASWILKEKIAKVIKAERVVGFDFNGRENVVVEEIVRRIKAGTFGKLEGIMPCNNN
ncbi:hypothetical protein Q3G72_016260 [Acer saccharum]|nr:hypothetical protein Q3G72_016260 [Acer saccharum]